MACWRRPIRLGTQQVFLRDHFQDGPDVLRHAAVNEHQAFLQFRAFRRNIVLDPKLWCVGIRRPRLMPNSGSPSVRRAPQISLMPGQTPPESCQPPPEPPSHSPSNGAGQHQPPFVLGQRALSDFAWPVARMQTEISEASRLVETARREPLGISLTWLTSSNPRPGPTSRASKSARFGRNLQCPAAQCPPR
jgi:hypothetical protein